MKNIFVIGTGTMGLDIAQVFSTFGYNVHMFGRTPESTGRAAAKLAKGLNKRVERGKIEREKADAIIAGITFTNTYDDAKDADLVIEAIVENVDLKKILFTTLDGICPENTIFATNTSSISITEIAGATKRADKFIGMHFFNPATVMKLVELIRGMHTSDETFAAIRELTVAIGKEPVEVAEAPGFVVNRLLIPMINEACEIVQNGVASPADVDNAMKLGANHPMGPLALGDLIGLDVCLAIMDTLYNETHDSKYRASCLLRKMVRAGKLGRKTGCGFFQY
ncbi:MAG: 3-hydroxybutyryl-CoA dehydrogenase [Clostridia bacterium]|nr:3-hydroxybutyryl-CoA dehydrogenase [Clostridia bacterium]MBQ3937863.1 3-hydroxybutyryl-CoA dehydrogenase [Clostridia bacterium]MBQ5488427.1 3-hydroxybutyryl-CoA dehydrogenase [Clostridia bacterium]